MQHFIRATALIFVVALFAIHDTTVSADAKEGEWAKGWNTWKTSAEGDWIQYSVSGIAGYKQEVLAVKGDNVTYTHTMLDKEGNVNGQPKEHTKHWSKIKVQGKLPFGDIDVTWVEAEIQFGNEKLACDVAQWSFGKGEDAAVQEIYYCKDVPCGGIVKTTNNGKDIVWMTEYGKGGKDVKGAAGVEPEPAKSKLPRFYAAADNKAVVKISGTGRDTSYQLRTVTRVEEEMSTWTVVACDAEGKADGNARTTEIVQTKEGWDKDYSKPSETGVKLKVEAGEFVCDVFKSEDGGRETTEWVSEGLSVKKVVKSSGKETVVELVSFTMK